MCHWWCHLRLHLPLLWNTEARTRMHAHARTICWVKTISFYKSAFIFVQGICIVPHRKQETSPWHTKKNTHWETHTLWESHVEVRSWGVNAASQSKEDLSLISHWIIYTAQVSEWVSERSPATQQVWVLAVIHVLHPDMQTGGGATEGGWEDDILPNVFTLILWGRANMEGRLLKSFGAVMALHK